jgi:hypothetical protein
MIGQLRYIKVHHVEFSPNLFLVWMKIEFLEISSAILYRKILDREFCGIRLKIMRKLFNYDQNINSLAFRWFLALFREIRDRVIFPYKIADEISKNSIFIQTKDKFDENSTWRTFKYPNHEIQKKKVKSFSKIKKLGSFFDFHTKWSKLQNRGMHLLAVILGFGG